MQQSHLTPVPPFQEWRGDFGPRGALLLISASALLPGRRGKDLRAVSAGFSNNFHLSTLKLEGTDTRVYLVDAIDNGNRSSGVREALYAYNLTVPSGTTLNLNGIHLYTQYSYEYVRVQARDGSKFGGGQIVDFPAQGYKVVPVLPLLLAGLRDFFYSQA